RTKYKYPTIIDNHHLFGEQDHPVKAGIDPKCRSTKPLCPDSFAKVMKSIDTFIFDADVYSKKLAKLGYYPSVMNKNTLVNPAAVVADILHQSGLDGKRVYLIGEQGLRDEMDELGIEYFGHGPEKIRNEDGSGAFMYDIKLEDNVGAVVVGYEKHFDYTKMMKAANYLREKGVLFVATNEDETCPGPNPEVVIPDAGPIVAAIRCASGRDPLTVGKPCTSAFNYIKRKWNINPSRTMMIGD
ncbi:hypothetical protein CAEBREN_29285, partial [Caenorhabditis brenneri]